MIPEGPGVMDVLIRLVVGVVGCEAEGVQEPIFRDAARTRRFGVPSVLLLAGDRGVVDDINILNDLTTAYAAIELSFSVIKKVMKNQYQIQSDTAPLEFAHLILRAGMSAITPQIARNQFRHCRIHITDNENK